ncbi:hypothetical protein E3N88_43820 [Mikania micrantha]|uniref:DUF4283 domain-containing protein n=1 Tax=Mikania micrantha TaxID=192012 RepID=A0A5N6LDT2_9ASTR|nr:hypothetical protein E3N88_43820 [Mikania micrantha]
MDYHYVNTAVRRLWHAFDFEEVTKNAAGYFFFKFKSEQGISDVLENGPWLIRNVLLFLNRWECRLGLEKAELTTIPLWVAIHGIPMDLWPKESISRMSAIGFPQVMDRVQPKELPSENPKQLEMGSSPVAAQATTKAGKEPAKGPDEGISGLAANGQVLKGGNNREVQPKQRKRKKGFDFMRAVNGGKGKYDEQVKRSLRVKEPMEVQFSNKFGVFDDNVEKEQTDRGRNKENYSLNIENDILTSDVVDLGRVLPQFVLSEPDPSKDMFFI